jgi:P4 family phage/plasmid primase-like protien
MIDKQAASQQDHAGVVTGFFSELQEDHAQALIERGISGEQAAARGYYSTGEKRHLESLGFNQSQAATAASHRPVLVIPLHRPDGEIENYQIRPNRPREVNRDRKKPRILKYELPANTKTVIVCPPTECQRESLKAAGVPLFITESVLKADAGLSISLLTVGILGVDGWRARNVYDGVTTHPAWEEINLKRDVYFTHDSDSLENRRVRRAIKRHRNWLVYKGANVKYIWLPPKADGSKCGLDDFIGERKAQGLTDEEIRAELLKYAADEMPNDDTLDSAEPTFNATDLGNAERVILQHSDKVRYCETLGGWFVWDGRRFRKDETGVVYRLAQETVRTIYVEASRTLEEEKRAELGQWAHTSERLQRIEAMIRLASKQEAVAIMPDAFDKDPYLLNANNGTIDLRKGSLKLHNPTDLITKLAPVDYDPDAEMPLIKEWLLEIMDGNQDMVSFLQRAVGYSLTGDTREQILLICYGVGANGKSTFLGLIQELLGDYATATSTSTLMVKRTESIPCDVAMLKGARFVAAAEAEAGQRFAESLVKQLTGGDVITARYLHCNPFTFKPTFKIWMAVNHKPMIRGTDVGIWRRIRLVPFTVVFPDDKQDKALSERLREELPGLLTWAVAGCLEWQKNGLGVPDEVTRATGDYRDEMDVLGQFIEERCRVLDGLAVQSSVLFNTWVKWCEANGEFKGTNKSLSLKLEEKGFKNTRRKSGIWFLDIGLNAETEDEGEED